mgnify:CR=1 FL=1
MQMKKVAEAPYTAYLKLKPYLSKNKIKIFLKKVRYFVQLVAKERRRDKNSFPFAEKTILY